MDATTSSSAIVDVDGIDLEVRRWAGDGVPILMLHEGLGSVDMWRDFPARLAAETRRQVVAWSRRGYGRSAALPDKRDPDYMHREAAVIPALLDRLGIGRAHFFGHSDGGTIALLTAARTPDRVASLILEAPHVMVEPLTYKSIAEVKRNVAETGLIGKLARYHDRSDEVFWRWNDIWLDPRFRDWNIEADLSGVSTPALLIQGADDEYGTMEQLDRIEARLSDTERLELRDCRHSPHRDQPQQVLDAVRSFLGDKE